MRDRAKQALVKMALEPEWEARFEPNSYGFRPGRSCHDAVEAIFGALKNKQAFVLDADIAGCFDNISHAALLEKLDTTLTLRRVVKAWLQAGVMEGEAFQETESGTPQGGVVSPLLANIALHGLESETKKTLADDLFRYRKEKYGKASHDLAQQQISIIRYADDFVVLHESEAIILKAKAHIEEWLKSVGLTLKPSKTRIAHSLEIRDETRPGFDFLGFGIRQFRVNDNKLGYRLLTKPSRDGVKRHAQEIRQVLRRLRGAPQDAVIRKLNPIVKGWSRYYTPAVSRKAFEWLDDQVHQKLWRWARFRHPHKGEQWVKRKYFRRHGNDQWRFMTHEGKFLIRHADHAIRRHVKVQGTKSPYDGEWTYWAARLGHAPGVSPRVAKLLKRQGGRCGHCRKWFTAENLLEVHHRNHERTDNRLENLLLVHRHCHDVLHGKGMCVKHQAAEEPDESKGSRPVLKPSREG